MSTVTSSMDTFTCITCRVAFKDAEFQRLHYKTDWHRYNLKRKVAELPPVTSEEFQRRVYNQRNADEILRQDKNVYCGVCRKSFGNQNAYDNHLNSKKHKDNEKNGQRTGDGRSTSNSESEYKKSTPASKMEADENHSDIEEVDSDEWEDDAENPIDNNDCLFCMQHSRNFIKNLEHMTIVHSFFIPDIEFCTDLNGLLKYLGEKISDGFMCLWCNEKGRTFHTADAARKHMLDKGHCKMIHEGVALAEYADFYDYSSSYPDAEETEIDVDEEVNLAELDGSDYQLVLPSGVTVGHRSLMKYYKQSVNHNRAVVAARQSDKRLHKVLAQYRAAGWTVTQQAAAARKARDLHYLKRIKAKFNMKMGLKNNSLLQKHFRRQVQF